MEMAESGYLYTVAILGMTFIGFSALVMLLRQTVGLKLRPFDALFAYAYMEFGLIISMGALLPPLVRLRGKSPDGRADFECPRGDSSSSLVSHSCRVGGPLLVSVLRCMSGLISPSLY
jgi:hypothetical protein